MTSTVTVYTTVLLIFFPLCFLWGVLCRHGFSEWSSSNDDAWPFAFFVSTIAALTALWIGLFGVFAAAWGGAW